MRCDFDRRKVRKIEGVVALKRHQIKNKRRYTKLDQIYLIR